MAWTKTSTSLIAKNRLMTFHEVVANDSDKTLVFNSDVGVGEFLHILSVRATLATSGTAGNRRVTLELIDADAVVVLRVEATTVVPATTTEIYNFQTGLAGTQQGLGGLVSTEEYDTLTDHFYLGKGMSMRIYDSAAVDAAADDLTVHILGQVHSPETK